MFKDLDARLAAFSHATLSGVWEGRAPEPQMAQILDLLKRMEQAGSGGTVDDHAIASAANALIAAGSTDPMVLYAAARFGRLDALERLNLYWRAYNAFEDSPYPPIRRAICMLRYALLFHDPGRPLNPPMCARHGPRP